MPVLIGPRDLFTEASWARFVAWFWSRVDRSGGPDACWPWTGSKHEHGYGLLRRFLNFRAHRLAWMLVNGPVPAGLDILHGCDNPPCCNPSHLEPGTKSQNMKDAYRRGRHPGNGCLITNAKITAEQAREIVRRRDEPRRALAAEFGLSLKGIDRVRKGETWATT